MFVSDIIEIIEEWAPLEYSEDFDNVGLLTGDPKSNCTGVLITLDTIESIIDEAIKNKCNLIVSFHPIIFSSLKKISKSDYVQKTIYKAIQNNISIYAIHTSLDNHKYGVNHKIAEKLNLINTEILLPKNDTLRKLIVNVPESNEDDLLKALHDAGAGILGNYENCSFSIEGKGTFKGNELSNPNIGDPEKKTSIVEKQIQLVFQKHHESRILKTLFKNHPYESVAYDILNLNNLNPDIGMGVFGSLKKSLSENDFIELLKKTFKTPLVRHSKLLGKPIKKVALLGGSGSFAINSAIKKQADVFLTSDLKYHNFFMAENKIVLMDIGHYESEQYTKNLIFDFLKEKLSSFAVVLSSINTNPVNYS
ncbi:MAG: Nif3-like dinuclear metal center hexameric protein [Flavobacteriaceae bacterium]|nr:Nif3-like dinuclear metal center hexameric protein [Flavobacteriaceae bacterium]|tara:strand:- start:11036 stop:12130 length:1095 start_codon:yes stop_codon:yes gene_type:complete